MGKPKAVEDKCASNKKYCKRYRERNMEKLRKTEKERKKLEREYEKFFCPEKYKKRLEQDRIRVREYRERIKKNQRKLSESVPQTPQPLSSSSSRDVSENILTQGNKNVFRSKQSLHGSVKRAEKCLPNSPRKKMKYSTIWQANTICE